MNANGVSVVTTTWNEAENIEKLVEAVHNALHSIVHELIIVDDSSTDGTAELAANFADLAVTKKREGQSKGLLFGMQLAKYPRIITIDADLENDPKYIPQLLQQMEKFDVVVASRTAIPRIAERVASKTLGRIVGVKDTFSNFRGFRKENTPMFVFRGGETFGAEFLIIAKKNGLRIGEIVYAAPPRRRKPRIGNKVRANTRIFWALVKSLILYFE